MESSCSPDNASQGRIVPSTEKVAIRWLSGLIARHSTYPAGTELAFNLAANAGSAPQLTGQEYRTAVNTLAEMKKKLADRIDEIRPQTYCEASRFLVDLRTHMRLRTVSTVLHAGE